MEFHEPHTTNEENTSKLKGKLPQSVVVVGKRWFDRKNGNTYFTALIIVDGKIAGNVGPSYGYGDQYVQAAGDFLESKGLIPEREKYSHGGKPALWMHLSDLGVEYVFTVADVGRKKDL